MRPQTEKRHWRRSRLSWALAASIVGHLALFLAFLGSGSNGGDLLSGDGMGDVEAMEVSLVGSRAEAVSAAPAVVDPAAELLARLGAGQSQAYQESQTQASAPSVERASLDDLLNEAAGPQGGSAQGKVDGRADQAREGAQNANGSEIGGARRAQGAAAGRGGLWSVIEPCWRRQRVPQAAHARLVVELDLMGRLASPPQVIRTDGMRLDRDQMLTEARAFDALTACMPAARGQFSGEHVLDFRRDR